MSAMSLALLPFRCLVVLAVIVLQLGALTWFSWAAYKIRMYPIEDFGYTIHEFDPWFNYRAAEYYAAHGTTKFFQWYDYMSWYPIGRPIGTTIYPGMQQTAVAIWEGSKMVPNVTYEVPQEVQNAVRPVLKAMKKRGAMLVPPVPKTFDVGPMSILEICCMIPPWFGSVATLFTGLFAYEITRSVNAGVMAAGVMSILPAHLMRSVGGKYDNECVAMAAICSTFWLWLLSIRTPKWWPIGVLTGLSYVYMVAAWGGYIFVLNMIGVHALMLVGLGRFNSGVHKAYSLFYVIGTFGAIQIPVVGMQPLRSMEQLGPFGIFVGFQVLAFCDSARRRRKMTTWEFIRFRIFAMVCLLGALVAVAVVLYPTGYFGPLSARIRGLFVKHTKTGNPLVDSVAEHQPASSGIYQNYLNLPLDYCLIGGFVTLWNRNNGVWFLYLYAFIALHFSGKMSRLVLICAPICSVACGIWCGFLLDHILEPFLLLLGKKGYTAPVEDNDGKAKEKEKEIEKENGKPKAKAKADEPKAKGKKGKKSSAEENVELAEWEEDVRPGGMAQILRQVDASLPADFKSNLKQAHHTFDNNIPILLGRAFFGIILLTYVTSSASGIPQKVNVFVKHCDDIAKSMSTAKVKYKVQQRDGTSIMIDDYWVGYKWLETNTATDARVMAWWDYGYQITGIGNRTSIADGNTWNHEHIATLGRVLTSPQKKAHNAIRHLADYVLVWAGGRGDDLAKSPHLARIGNSVFPDHCGDDDPTCTKFGFYDRDQAQPTPMMKKSLLYNLVQHNIAAGAKAQANLFEEVWKSKYGLMRIFKVLNVSQESKEWIDNPNNKICDAPGSWYCVGQYPPALDNLINQRKSFSQVEDFNKKGEKSAYTKHIDAQQGKKEL